MNCYLVILLAMVNVCLSQAVRKTLWNVGPVNANLPQPGHMGHQHRTGTDDVPALGSNPYARSRGDAGDKDSSSMGPMTQRWFMNFMRRQNFGGGRGGDDALNSNNLVLYRAVNDDFGSDNLFVGYSLCRRCYMENNFLCMALYCLDIA